MDYFLSAFQKYADFEGRSTTAEYWYFYLYNTLAMIAVAIVDAILFNLNNSQSVRLVFSLIYVLATIIPNYSITVRRLHDTNHSGWWMFITMIPIIGSIWYFIALISEGTAGSNDYGPDPKEPSSYGRVLTPQN
jgi:uncharacterized membrane protein YhaH (DUF805 family)